MFKVSVVGALCAVAIVACGKKEEPSSAPSAAPPPPLAADAALPTVNVPKPRPPTPEPLNYTVVKPAFGGTVPKFPQLSRDGASAAIDLSEPFETSLMTTYEVGFQSDTGKLERIAVLDRDTAAKLAADPATEIDKVAAEKSALTIAKRLADGAFSEFAVAINQGALDTLGRSARTKGEDLPVSIDKAKLVASVVVNKSGPTSLKLRLDNPTGKKVIERLVPAVTGSSRNSECDAAPRLGGVWFDTARKRMLVQIAFVTTAGCFVPATYQLWKLP